MTQDPTDTASTPEPDDRRQREPARGAGEPQPETSGADQAEALNAERAALVATLTEVGPAASTLVSGWTAADLAAHLVMTEQMRGIPTFLGRTVVARYGIRLNDTFRPAMTLQMRRFRRRGFHWALQRLARPSPRLLARPAVLPVSVFEIFVHHEDLRRANNQPHRGAPFDLIPSIHWLLRYQQRLLQEHRLTLQVPGHPEIRSGDGPNSLTVNGPPQEVLLWLAGRPHAADVEASTDTKLPHLVV